MFKKFDLKGISWGLGIGEWGLGSIPNPPSPFPISIILKLNN